MIGNLDNKSSISQWDTKQSNFMYKTNNSKGRRALSIHTEKTYIFWKAQQNLVGLNCGPTWR